MTLRRFGLVLCAILAAACKAPPHPVQPPSAPPSAVQQPQPTAPADISHGEAPVASTATPAPVDPHAPPLTRQRLRHVRFEISHANVTIAPGVTYYAWTFGGTIPGPFLRVTQGDTVDFTLVNRAPQQHSIDFHVAEIAPSRYYVNINPGDSLRYRFVARVPGVFMYHCGTAPVAMHIANGMYGAIIVEPKNMPPAQKEYVLVSSEWYLNAAGDAAPANLDVTKAEQMTPDWVTWNGYAAQYKTHPLTADPGDTVRFWVVDGGPSLNTEFHVVGTILKRAWINADMVDAPQHDIQTAVVPAGGGGVFDVTIPKPGIYPFVSHSFASVMLGEVGLLNVGNVGGTMSH